MFTLTHTNSGARRGILTTARGVIETPAFMPVGTQGAVKALTAQHLEDIGAQIILGNTYHLMLRPGDELIARRGGLHKFIGWNKPILTDSGGYQVFSLAHRRRIDESGVKFSSHLDGSTHVLTPERAVDIQWNLGSDVAMVLDECPALPSTPEIIDRSLQLTARWARRSRDRFLETKEKIPGPFTSDVSFRARAQFGICQGGAFPELRAKSAELTVTIGFDGYAIGGLSVGEPNETMYQV
ncbi:MAG: tRNA guanosine(34) transglycosylase Tgt, partial [Vicinamibacterales bacterium]